MQAFGLLITLTDPLFLGAAVLGLVVAGYVVYTIRQAGASPSSAGARTGEAGVQPQATGTAQELETPAPEDEPPEAETKPSLKPGKGRTLAELARHEEVDDASLLSRFVLNANGDTVGETLALEHDGVVLKTGDGFAVVALDAIIEKDGMLLVDASIDWEAANEAGEQWEKASTDRMEYDDKGMPVSEE